MTLPRRTIQGEPTNLGRPLTLDPETANTLVLLLRQGLTQTDACDATEVPRSTFYSWLNRAKTLAENPPPKPTPEEQQLLDFLNAVTGARARAKATAVGYIRQAMPDDWRAAAWFLERSFPEEFGRRDHLTLAGDEDVVIELVWPETHAAMIEGEEIEDAEVVESDE